MSNQKPTMPNQDTGESVLMGKRVLTGKRILVTRTREQSSVLAASLQELGAEVLEVPTIRIVPPASYAPLDQALECIAKYDTLLVTSANAARVLVERKLPPWETQPFTVAIGPATAQALRNAGLRVDLQPEPSIAESIVRELAPSARGKRMLLVRAVIARQVMPEMLRAAGASVEIVDAYQTVLAEESRSLLEQAFAVGAPLVDAITCTSSSTVENFFALLGEEMARTVLQRSRVCSIGPVTSKTLRNYGVQPATEASEHDIAGLVAAIRSLLAE